MKYTKPATTPYYAEIRAFYDSLPAEFEIVEPGNVQVRWPEGLTRERLMELADSPHDLLISRGAALRSLASIAPVEKKKQTIEVWESGGHLIAVPGNHKVEAEVIVGWRKVGECEVTE